MERAKSVFCKSEERITVCVVGKDVRTVAFQPGPLEGLLCKLDGFLSCQREIDFLTSVWGISRCLDTLLASFLILLTLMSVCLSFCNTKYPEG